MSSLTIQPIFDFEAVAVRLDCLLPSRPARKDFKSSAKFRALVASIKEIGIIEPVTVFPQRRNKFLILDGHARVEALRELGFEEALCLVATQDDSYTYNKKVSNVAPIQANRMILKALDAGVSEERIANTLNLSMKTVRDNRQLLQGICPEAVELLRNKQVARKTFTLLKRVKPLRQIEMAEVMVASGVYSAPYAHSLVMMTPDDQLLISKKHKRRFNSKPEEITRIEGEMRLHEKEFRMLDETYNEHVMSLTLARGYLRPLLNNNRIVRFLSQHYRELLTEFQRIVEAGPLDR
jgi:ParB-like chromosome segregation protein Spo0J